MSGFSPETTPASTSQTANRPSLTQARSQSNSSPSLLDAETFSKMLSSEPSELRSAGGGDVRRQEEFPPPSSRAVKDRDQDSAPRGSDSRAGYDEQGVERTGESSSAVSKPENRERESGESGDRAGVDTVEKEPAPAATSADQEADATEKEVAVAVGSDLTDEVLDEVASKAEGAATAEDLASESGEVAEIAIVHADAQLAVAEPETTETVLAETVEKAAATPNEAAAAHRTAADGDVANKAIDTVELEVDAVEDSPRDGEPGERRASRGQVEGPAARESTTAGVTDGTVTDAPVTGNAPPEGSDAADSVQKLPVESTSGTTGDEESRRHTDGQRSAGPAEPQRKSAAVAQPATAEAEPIATSPSSTTETREGNVRAGIVEVTPASNASAPAAAVSPANQRLQQNLLPRAAGDSDASARVSVESSKFVPRVAKAFAAAAQRGGEVRIRLSPPELGSIRLEVKMQGGALTARLDAETQAARQAILENLPVLRERLAEQGLRVEQFDIGSLDRQDRHELASQQQDQSDQQHQATYGQGEEERAGEEGGPETPHQAVRQTATSLDVIA